MHTGYEMKIACLVLPTITGKLPQVKINTKSISLPEGINMADPEFYQPNTVDLLLGAGLFWQLICKESIQQAKGMPRLQNTLLGWIVGGELIDTRSSSKKEFCGLVTNAELHAQLERFWNQEETHEKRCFTKEEVDCELQFAESTRRDETGRFIVELPKRKEVELGNSEDHATRRLYALERNVLEQIKI